METEDESTKGAGAATEHGVSEKSGINIHKGTVDKGSDLL